MKFYIQTKKKSKFRLTYKLLMQGSLHFKTFKTLNLNINKASFKLKVVYPYTQKTPKNILKLFKTIDVNQPEVKEKTMLEIFEEKFIL